MKIKKIAIENYRGIKERQEIFLSDFVSIVGKNDSGKSIILNAIATFLNPKDYPITESDFNNLNNPIIIECHFVDEDLRNKLQSKIKSKIKKDDGLEEFLNDILATGSLIVVKKTSIPGKKFETEEILIKDYEEYDFSSLYEKSDEELKQILEKYNIDIPVKDKGRNSKLEKIKYIKKYCDSNEKNKIDKLISDKFKVMSMLPQVEMFVSDYGLKPDTSFKSHSVTEIKDYFERETQDDNAKLKQIEREIQNEMNKEAEAIKNYMLDYTSSLKKVEIIPNIIWKDAIKSVDVTFQFDGDDKPIPMTHKGTGYRRLFMVARFRYLAESTKGENVIYLIEEPEAFLHPSAQEDLLNALKEISEENQIIITTHSPVFAGATDYSSIILCRKIEQSVYESASEENKNDFIMKIVDELGIKPSYNLRDFHEKILFVESKHDAQFYNIICKEIFGKNLLKDNKVLVLPFGGENIDGFINIDYFHKSGRKLYLIIDSDKGNCHEKQEQRIHDFESKGGKGYLLKKRTIENYYHPRAIERVYSIDENIFDYFTDEDNVKEKMKQIIREHELKNKNIKIKNNIKIFEAMTKEEWEEVLEEELIQFLKELLGEEENS